MRKKRWYGLLGFYLLLVGCDKEHELVKDIAGQWNIQKITYQTASGDSVVENSTAYLGQMYFDKCKWKKSRVDQCAGYYQFDTRRRIEFGYTTPGVLNIQIQTPPTRRDNSTPEAYLTAQKVFWEDQPQLGLNYTMPIRSDNRLVLTGQITLSYIYTSAAVVSYPATIELIR